MTQPKQTQEDLTNYLLILLIAENGANGESKGMLYKTAVTKK